MNIVKGCVINCYLSLSLLPFTSTQVAVRVKVVGEEYKQSHFGGTYHEFKVIVLKYKCKSKHNKHFPKNEIIIAKAGDLYNVVELGKKGG